MSAESTELIAVGKIGRPVGLRGECRLFPFGEGLLEQDFPCEVLSGFNKRKLQTVTLLRVSGIVGNYKAQFEGFTDRDAIDEIKNSTLYITRDQLPEVDNEDEFYFYQLKGLTVEDEDGGYIGVVDEVFNFPTTDALEVLKKNGSKILIPFRKEIAVSVSLEDKRIVISAEALEELL